MCPKLSISAIISETMHQIEILGALYFIQLLILVSGGGPPTWEKNYTPPRGGGNGKYIFFVYGTKDTGGGLIFSIYGKWGEVN